MWSDLPILDRLQDCWDPITETQLAELEAAIGHRFPDDYRQFALQFNGGIWRHPVTCAVEHPRWVTTEPLIRYCFGVVTHPRFRYQDLLRGKLEHFDEGIPSTFVHIMEAMGTSICIDLDVDESGGIYLFDASECDSDIDPLHWIADSFSEFLGLLVPDKDESPLRESLPVFQAAERGVLEEVRNYLADGGKVDIRNERGHTLLVSASFVL